MSQSVAQQVIDEIALPAVSELVNKGFDIGDGGRAKLTAPAMTPDLTKAEQVQLLQAIAGSERRYKEFIRKSVVAPFRLFVKTAEESTEEKTIRRLDLYYLAYGDLEIIRDKNLMSGFTEQKQKEAAFESYVEPLEEEEAEEGEGFVKGEPTEPNLYRYRFPLIDKVVVSGLVEGQALVTDRFLIESSASPVDKLADATNPTQWRPIPRDTEGDDDLGPAQPFPGLAGYLQAAQFEPIPGAVLVECHAVFVEPEAWFNGRNLLASKLPILVQNNVRSFRRKLSNAMKQRDENQE